jgi:hypothetical protein
VRAKPDLKAIAKFALLFAATYTILIIPWPGFDPMYGNYFRAFGAMVFSHEGRQEVTFAPSVLPPAPNLDTKISLGNRDLGANDGKLIHVQTDFDSRSIGWVPTALTVALIVATPIPFRRRLGALAGGLVLVHAFILLTLQSWIWNNAAAVGLATYSDFGKQIADALSYSLMDQIGASFSIPVLIWILVTFRRQDLLSHGLT